MRSNRSIFFLSLLAALALSSALTAAAQEAVSEKALDLSSVSDSLLQDFNGNGIIEIMAFGDSITLGRGDFNPPGIDSRLATPITRPKAGYPLRLETWLGLPITNLGKSGEMLSYGGLARFAAELPRLRPDLVIIADGSNDAYHYVPNSEFVAAMQAVINISRVFGSRVLLVTFSPSCLIHAFVAPTLLQYSNELRVLAAVNESSFADVERAFQNSCEATSCDLLNLPEGLHPNINGYDVMAETIAATLLDIDLFAEDGPRTLEEALGLPEASVRTKPNPVS